MSEPGPTGRRGPGVMAAWVTAVLAAAAALALGYRLALATGPDDTEASESPRVLAVARQVTDGPGGLYGPFGARNPLVLIHAPLYYRLAALLAWPLAGAGLDPTAAALAAGRGLSFVALLATLYAAGRLARLGGAPRAAGWWAALLIAAAPVLDGLPVTVLPDLLGVALQTTGTLLVLSALDPGHRGRGPILAAGAAFGAAVCVKQTYVVAPAVSAALLVAARARGRLPAGALGPGALLPLAVAAAVYGADGVVTGGRVFEPIFVVAGSLGRLRPANWARAVGLVAEVGIGSLGLVAVWAAAGLAAVCARPGRVRGAVAAVGGVVLVATLAAFAAGGRGHWYDAARLAGTGGALLAVFVVAAVAEPRVFLGNRVDAALWAYWSGEAALTVYLFRASTGAWTNYALPAVVLGCVLAARCLARAFEGARSALPLVPAGLVSLSVLYLAWADVSASRHVRERDRAALGAVFARVGRDPRGVFFVGRPGLNRVHGRAELVYDDWLYPVFESVKLAERRSGWLGRALGSGSVRYVVAGSESPRVEGLDRDLAGLGFVPSFRVGPFYAWERLPGG